MHRLVIRGATIVDGTGRLPRCGDIAVDGERLTQVGGRAGRGSREIDADGLIVTPGWVDIHTHYDLQATWDTHLIPSGWHGVTTIIMGNCGVGLAPVRVHDQTRLIDTLRGIENTPIDAARDDTRWPWQSVAEYLDALDTLPRALDVGVQIPHAAVRLYVLGPDEATRGRVADDELTDMAALVREGLRAGALGFSTSRTVLHRSFDGQPLAGTAAEDAELLGIAQVLGEAGHGVFQMISDLAAPRHELALMEGVSRATGGPVTFALVQSDDNPTAWHDVLRHSSEASTRGAQLRPQVAVRAIGVLLGLQNDFHPFVGKPAYRAVAHLPLRHRVRELSDAKRRRQILAESSRLDQPDIGAPELPWARVFPLGNPPNYEPQPDHSIAHLARRQKRPTQDVVYDHLLHDDGAGFLYLPLANYCHFDLEASRAMLEHSHTVVGLSDAGAHIDRLCEAGAPTFLLTHWVRDRQRGPRLPLAFVVKSHTHDTARLYGLHDRGTLDPGKRADLNLIDFEKLSMLAPEVYRPADGVRRIVQRADGYVMTIKSGAVVFEHGVPTGALPGRVLRGTRWARPPVG